MLLVVPQPAGLEPWLSRRACLPSVLPAVHCWGRYYDRWDDGTRQHGSKIPGQIMGQIMGQILIIIRNTTEAWRPHQLSPHQRPPHPTVSCTAPYPVLPPNRLSSIPLASWFEVSMIAYSRGWSKHVLWTRGYCICILHYCITGICALPQDSCFVSTSPRHRRWSLPRLAGRPSSFASRAQGAPISL